MRIEDDIVVTKNGLELMTDVPRTVEDIESIMTEGKQLVVSFPQQKFGKALKEKF